VLNVEKPKRNADQKERSAKMDSRFSPNENKILTILGRKKMSIVDITKEFYSGKGPVSASTVVSNAIRRINFKCEYYKLDWHLDGQGMGRVGRIVWRTKK
jgi:hypothetical protein